MRNDAGLLDHILAHIDNGTTDLGDQEWHGPVENYRSQARFDAERRLMRRKKHVTGSYGDTGQSRASLLVSHRLAQHYTLSLAEPESPTRTLYNNYQLTRLKPDGATPPEEEFARAKRHAAFVTDTGAAEDAKVMRAIQTTIGSGANSHYRFGLFESAIGHPHRHRAYLDHAERDILNLVSKDNT
jgi:hypothetical protein